MEGKTEKAKLQKVHNVSGSSAGAGSGEFHEFRNNRRKEMFRLEAMDKEAEEEERRREFEYKLEQNRLEAEARTSKNALKRKRRKEALRGGNKKAKTGSEDEVEDVLKEEGAIDGIIAADPAKVNSFTSDGSFLSEALKKVAEEKAPPKWVKKT